MRNPIQPSAVRRRAWHGLVLAVLISPAVTGSRAQLSGQCQGLQNQAFYDCLRAASQAASTGTQTTTVPTLTAPAAPAVRSLPGTDVRAPVRTQAPMPGVLGGVPQAMRPVAPFPIGPGSPRAPGAEIPVGAARITWRPVPGANVYVFSYARNGRPEAPLRTTTPGRVIAVQPGDRISWSVTACTGAICSDPSPIYYFQGSGQSADSPVSNSSSPPRPQTDLPSQRPVVGSGPGASGGLPPTRDMQWPVAASGGLVAAFGPCLLPEYADRSDCAYLSSRPNASRDWFDVNPFMADSKGESGTIYHLAADLNLGSDDEGEPVYAVADGAVAETYSAVSGWGNAIAVSHNIRGAPYTSLYGHIDFAPGIRKGVPVWKGRHIGNIAARVPSLNDYPPHLHFEWREGSDANLGNAYVSRITARGPQGQVHPILGLLKAAGVSSPTMPRNGANPAAPPVAIAPPSVPAGTSPGSPVGPGPEFAGTNVQLRWLSVPGADDYDFGVTELDTGALVISERTRATNWVASLKPGRSYRWNVRACKGSNCSGFSQRLHFTTRPAALAAPPALPAAPAPPKPPIASQPSPPAMATPAIPAGLSPGSPSAPGPQMSSARVELRWSAVSGADEYDYGVTDTSTGRLVVDTQTRGTSVTVRLDPGKAYRWNVRACNAGKCSSFTQRLHFTTPPDAAAAPPPPPAANITPAMPVGLTPGLFNGPGPRVTSTRVELRWLPVPGADEYDYGVTDISTGRLVVDTQTRGTSVKVRLDPRKAYRWNVRACNAGKCSAFTPRMHFTTP